MHSLSKPIQLRDFEQEAIQAVMLRADRLDKVEQHRIGKLVDKLENIKSRAIGNGDNQCVLCGEEFKMLGASGATCADCKKTLCTKCGVESLSAHKEPLLLCKICSETRETWKKTGAWFFKGFPKHVLPERKPDAYCFPHRGLKPKQPQQATRRVSKWAKSSAPFEQEALTSDREAESPSEDEGINLSAHSPSPRQRKDSADSLSPRTRSTAPSPCHMDSRTNSAVSPMFDTADYDLNSNEGGRERATESEDDVDQIFSHYKSIRRSVRPVHAHLAPAAQSFLAPAADDEEAQKTADDTVYGSLEFSLLYDSINHALHCTILRAKGLRGMDSNGLSDPYVKLHLLPKASKSNKLRTKTVHKTLNPEFNETLTYYGMFDADMAKKTVRFSVLDEDLFGHDFIGEARVPLRQLRPHYTKHFHIYLDQQHQLEKDDDLLIGENNLGKILLSLRYCTGRQCLVVGVVRCSSLPSRDSNGYSDPFVKIQLKPDPLKRKFKTAIKWKNLNPEFNEEFAFDVPPQELSKRVLEVAVWDKDYALSNDYIGGLRLGLASKGTRLRHWLDVMRKPEARHDKWHHLSAQLVAE